MSRYLICDVETIPDPAVLPLLDPVRPDSRLKDQVKIAESIREKTEARDERLGLNPDCCRIVVLGSHVVGGGDPTVDLCRDETEEKSALERFWRLYQPMNTVSFDTRTGYGDVGCRIVTFYGLKFDLPVLMRRSLYLGVPYPELNLDRYRTPHLDICQKLSFNGAIESQSLKFYCRRFGIPIEDTVNGSDVARLWAEGQYQAVADHCLADVATTHTLANKLGLLVL